MVAQGRSSIAAFGIGAVLVGIVTICITQQALLDRHRKCAVENFICTRYFRNCRLAINPAHKGACNYSIALGALSIIFAIASVAVMMFVGGRALKTGAGWYLSLGALAVGWWVAGAIYMSRQVAEIEETRPRNDYRHAIVGLAWAGVASAGLQAASGLVLMLRLLGKAATEAVAHGHATGDEAGSQKGDGDAVLVAGGRDEGTQPVYAGDITSPVYAGNVISPPVGVSIRPEGGYEAAGDRT